ncbi:MAG TPA: 30S ribosomal protein S4e [Candidatus Nanoarchaeia archaeon]|nr:30S ribosomal protein S4e [Candidatus Nanoarchaeia archaeon]
MSHLKSLCAPRTWHILRKGRRYIAKSSPGTHAEDLAMPLVVVLRDVLGVGKTRFELKKIMRQKDVLIDGKKMLNERFPIGLFDVLSIGSNHYRMIINSKGRVVPLPITSNEASTKVCKVKSKQLIKKGKMQVTFHDGTTLVTDTPMRVGDSVVVQLPKRTIVKVLTPTEGAHIYLMKGKHSGIVGKLIELKKESAVYSIDGEQDVTPKKYLVVVGHEKPLITLK